MITNRAGKHEFSLEWRWVVIWGACLGWRAYCNHDGYKKGDDDNGGDHVDDVDVNDDGMVMTRTIMMTMTIIMTTIVMIMMRMTYWRYGKDDIMMTIMLARNSTNERANKVKGDVIINDVIKSHRPLLWHFMITMLIIIILWLQ